MIYQGIADPQAVVSPGVAWTADQILQKVVEFGTGTQANIGRPAAGKTGTAQRYHDAWFVGFVPQLVAAVWVGYPQGQVSMSAPRTRIPHVLGGTWPAEIWHVFMTNATRGTPNSTSGVEQSCVSTLRYPRSRPPGSASSRAATSRRRT